MEINQIYEEHSLQMIIVQVKILPGIPPFFIYGKFMKISDHLHINILIYIML